MNVASWLPENFWMLCMCGNSCNYNNMKEWLRQEGRWHFTLKANKFSLACLQHEMLSSLTIKQEVYKTC